MSSPIIAFATLPIEGGGKAFIANNLIYNYEHRAIQFYGGGGGAPAEATIVGNVALCWPEPQQGRFGVPPEERPIRARASISPTIEGPPAMSPSDYLLIAEEVIWTRSSSWTSRRSGQKGFVAKDSDEVMAATLLEKAGCKTARAGPDRPGDRRGHLEPDRIEIIDAPPEGRASASERSHVRRSLNGAGRPRTIRPRRRRPHRASRKPGSTTSGARIEAIPSER